MLPQVCLWRLAGRERCELSRLMRASLVPDCSHAISVTSLHAYFPMSSDKGSSRGKDCLTLLSIQCKPRSDAHVAFASTPHYVSMTLYNWSLLPLPPCLHSATAAEAGELSLCRSLALRLRSIKRQGGGLVLNR